MLSSLRARQAPLIQQRNAFQPSKKSPLYRHFSNLKNKIVRKLNGSVNSHFEAHFYNSNADEDFDKFLGVVQCERCPKNRKFAAMDGYLTYEFKEQKKPLDSKVFTEFATEEIKKLSSVLPEDKKPIASEYLHKREYEKIKLYRDLKNDENVYRRKFRGVYNQLKSKQKRR